MGEVDYADIELNRRLRAIITKQQAEIEQLRAQVTRLEIAGDAFAEEFKECFWDSEPECVAWYEARRG